MLGGSGALASLLRGNGYVIVPEGVEGYDEGETVEVNLYGEVESSKRQESPPPARA
jgi:molybdopterin molybdotransferase